MNAEAYVLTTLGTQVRKMDADPIKVPKLSCVPKNFVKDHYI